MNKHVSSQRLVEALKLIAVMRASCSRKESGRVMKYEHLKRAQNWITQKSFFTQKKTKLHHPQVRGQIIVNFYCFVQLPSTLNHPASCYINFKSELRCVESENESSNKFSEFIIFRRTRVKQQ